MGIRDFVQGDYLSGTIRMIDALLIAASIAIGTGLVPVSYTHLDVYKRQAGAGIGHMGLDGGKLQLLHKGAGSLTSTGQAKAYHAAAAIGQVLLRQCVVGCLLYTSRCV